MHWLLVQYWMDSPSHQWHDAETEGGRGLPAILRNFPQNKWSSERSQCTESGKCVLVRASHCLSDLEPEHVGTTWKAHCIASLQHDAVTLLWTNSPVGYSRDLRVVCRCPLRGCRRQLRKSSLSATDLNTRCSKLFLHRTAHTFDKNWNWI